MPRTPSPLHNFSRKRFLSAAALAVGGLLTLRWVKPSSEVAPEATSGVDSGNAAPSRFAVKPDPRAVARKSSAPFL